MKSVFTRREKIHLDPFESEESILLKKALIALDNPERRDEWDVFGQFVADDLRQMSNLIRQ